MNEIQVKTIELKPAMVKFNYDELSNILDESLKKYDGLTFTEEDATECKKTITELNKGKKLLDDYRKKTKKELTASVTDFENRCKELNKKFDAVITPLKEQHQAFEKKRKEEKLQKIEEVIAQIIEEFELEEKYAVQIKVDGSYLNKSKTIKSIKEELTANAEWLKTQQEKEKTDKELIKSTVELANSKHEVNLTETAYVRLLDYKDVDVIKNQILDDAQNEAEKKIQEEKRNQVIAEQKETEPILQQEENDIPFADYTTVEIEDSFIDDDFINDPFVPRQNVLIKQYEVIGTKEQLEGLKKYMATNGIEWEVVE